MGIVLALVPVVFAGTCYVTEGPLHYYAEPIHARVIDEVTGQPIEGAAVVAVWYIESIMGSREIFAYSEAVTGRDGTFFMPGWGPKFRSPLYVFGEHDPDLQIYAPGHRAWAGDNRPAYIVPVFASYEDAQRAGKQDLTSRPTEGHTWRAARRFCYWNGKIVPLEPTANAKDEASDLDGLDSFSNFDEHQLPRFWRTWLIGWSRLPEVERQHVSLPGPVIGLKAKGDS